MSFGWGRPAVPRKRRCRLCQLRYIQERGGLCRRCFEEAKRAAAVVLKPQPTAIEVVPKRQPLRTVVVEGVEFEVMWDGSYDVPKNAAAPAPDEAILSRGTSTGNGREI